MSDNNASSPTPPQGPAEIFERFKDQAESVYWRREGIIGSIDDLKEELEQKWKRIKAEIEGWEDECFEMVNLMTEMDELGDRYQEEYEEWQKWKKAKLARQAERN